MAKKNKNDDILSNLKGFVRKGAASNSKSNIPTGHFPLDFVIHHGILPDKVDLSTREGYDPSKPMGLPMGKLVEIFGEEGGGKSSLAYRVVGYAQKMGYKCAWIDTENSFSNSLALINGVEADSIYYSDMSNASDIDSTFFAEDVFDAIFELIKNGVKVIVLDSVANLVPKERMEADASKRTIGIVARLMSENLGKIVNYAGKYGACVIFINQLREKIGVMFGNPLTTPGGRSLKHNASLRIEISKKSGADANIFIEDENGDDLLIGRNARVNIRKNRMAKPFMDGIIIPIFYEPYFPDIEEKLFDVGRQLKIISVRTGTFKWIENKDGNRKEYVAESRKAFIDNLRSKNLAFLLATRVLRQAKEDGVFLPPEITQWKMQQDKKTKKIESSDETTTKDVSPRGRKKKSSSDGDAVSE